MINLKYSVVIERTKDPNFFGFYSPDLEGFSVSGCSVEDCLKKADLGFEEHLQLLIDQGLPIPPINPHAIVTLMNTDRVLPAA